MGEIGRYVTFCGPTGKALPYLYPIDAIGVNGVHAVVVAPVLIRIELFRTGRTCQLLITQHEPEVENGRLPELGTEFCFAAWTDSSMLGKPTKKMTSVLRQCLSSGRVLERSARFLLNLRVQFARLSKECIASAAVTRITWLLEFRRRRMQWSRGAKRPGIHNM